MPELPEVETIKRGLEKKIINKIISEVQVKNPILIKRPQVNEFIARLKNVTVVRIDRRGKYIIIYFDAKEYLVIHLGMSGRLLYQPEKDIFLENSKVIEKHNHIFILFKGGSKVIYNDVRKFGKIWLLEEKEQLHRISSLGLEPLGPSFSIDKFQRILKNNNKNIKSFLMNQKNIAGIGNIYANEILFQSRVHPCRKVNSLKKDEIKRLYLNIKDILSKAIKSGGTTMIDESYLDLNGNKGEYGKRIMVYGKKADICPVCGIPLEIMRIDNRSTFICTNCQK